MPKDQTPQRGQIRCDGYVFEGYGKKRDGSPKEIWRSPESFIKQSARVRKRTEYSREERSRLNKEYRERQKLGLTKPSAYSSSSVVHQLNENADKYKEAQLLIDLQRKADRLLQESFDEEQRLWRKGAKRTEWRIPVTPSDYYQRNRESRLQVAKEKYHNNKEFYKEYYKRIYSTPVQIEKRKAHRREWYRNNKEKVRDLNRKRRKQKPECYYQYQAKRRCREREATVPLSRDQQGIVQTIYSQSRRLTLCTRIRWSVDHVMPISKGGKHEPTNLQCLTFYANSTKSDRYTPSHSGVSLAH